MFGAGAEAARGRVDAAVKTEGTAAYARLAAEPSAYGAVIRAADASVLSGRLVGQAQLADYLNAERSPAITQHQPTAEHSRSDLAHSPDPEVDCIVAFVQERLSRHPVRGDLAITVQDLREMQSELSQTTHERASQVIQALRPEDLQTWIVEMNDSSRLPSVLGTNIGGYTVPQQRGFYNMLARQLDVVGLVEVAQAIGDQQGEQTDFDGQLFGRAISGSATPENRVAFARQVLSESDTVSLSSDRNVALAAAEVIGGLGHSPALLNNALEGVTNQTIDAVSRAAVLDIGSRSRPDGLGVSRMPQVRLDAAPLGRMLDAIALSGNTDNRGRAFASAAGVMAQIGRGEPLNPGRDGAQIDGDEGVGQIRTSLTRILYADTTGVVERLDANSDVGGSRLTAYLESMIESENLAQIRGAIARIQLGDDLGETLVDRFGPEHSDDPPTDEQLGRSGALGHLSGALVAAIDNRQASREEKADRLSAIFELGTSGLSVPGGSVVSSVLSGLTERAAHALVDQYATGEKTLGETVFEIARPRISATHYYEGRSINNGPFEVARNSVVVGEARN